MTKLYLIRHGSTTYPSDVFSGSMDPDLSSKGKLQAEGLKDRLKFELITRFYCSQKKRAMQTAAIIAEPHYKNNMYAVPTQIGDLREISHGRWEGKTKNDVMAMYPAEYDEWNKDPYLFAPDGGETGLQVLNRILPCIKQILSDNQGQTCAVVSHKAAIRLIMCSFLGVDPRGYRDRFDLDPCSLTLLECNDSSYGKLIVYNDTAHYRN